MEKRWQPIKFEVPRCQPTPQDKLHLNLTGALKRVEELLADNNRLRDALASWEASWYDCHDGSEGACCKAHE